MTAVITTKKMTLTAVNSSRYFFLPFGSNRAYSLYVMRLASEAIRVPVPPMLTPSNSAL